MEVKKEHGFLRQSSWMVITTFVGGILMTLVHTVAAKMDGSGKSGEGEYSTFVTLLRLLIYFGIPTVALQSIFARQAAAVTNEEQEQRLIATVRAVLFGTFLIWLVCAVVVLVELRPISRLLGISNPASLYFMLAICLLGLWVPIVKGLLQGHHQFFGLGWVAISDGLGRFTVMLVVILIFGGKAAAAMFAVLAGQLASISIGAWLTRSTWSARSKVAFDLKGWLLGALPLTLGMGTILAMSSTDMLFVKSVLDKTNQTGLYSGAMLTGFAIIQFIAPVALVMFARVAKSAARSEGSASLGLTLKATISFGVLAGIGCTLLPSLPLRVIYFSTPEMWKAAPLVPWFAWALLPLTVANVLIQNILAHGRFKVVYWLVLVPLGYIVALHLQKPALIAMAPFDAFVRVIQTLGVASLVLCLLAGWFSRPIKATPLSDQVS
jgi:hypothetical protein